jgi:hypothetical protein
MQVADLVLDRVDERVVSEVGPPVVHVEERDVHDERVRWRHISGAIRSRVDERPRQVGRGARLETDVGAMGDTVLAVKRHGQSLALSSARLAG